MVNSVLEHLNFTVRDPKASAEEFCKLFDWRLRWYGDAIHGGTSYHVGGDDSYLALYAEGSPPADATDNYRMVNGLNHLGVVVDDLAEVEKRVLARGYETFNHADYDPGRRFYFRDANGIEIEVVSYA